MLGRLVAFFVLKNRFHLSWDVMTALVCVAGCEERFDPFTPRFECPQCGGLLDVEHDLEEIKKERSPDGWHRLLADRAASSFSLDRSGVWAHREWVMPDLLPRDVITGGEGKTPLVEYPDLAKRSGLARVFIKQCGHTLTGSFKDLGMTVLVSMANAMRRRGENIQALVCASTGDTSAALAAYGAMAKIPVVVLLPAGKVSPAQLVQPLAHGAHVLTLDGDFDDCMEVVQQVCRLPGMFLANSKNPLRLEGQKSVAFEIAWDLGWAVPDFVLVPSGNLGNVAALAKGFAWLKELGLTQSVPRLVACQVDAANPLYRAYRSGLKTLQAMEAQDTLANAIRIGNPVSWPRTQKALLETEGLVTSASEAELMRAQAEADRAGLFVCPHTATALAGLSKLTESGDIPKGASVVVVSTAHALKFIESKARFHTDASYFRGDEMDGFKNPPLSVPADLDIVRARLEDRLRVS